MTVYRQSEIGLKLALPTNKSETMKYCAEPNIKWATFLNESYPLIEQAEDVMGWGG